MPFGLTNAPTTFQSFMNMEFREHIHKYVLVIFYDIFIYSKNWKEHMQHFEVVLAILADRSLYEKLSKCEMLYLGHVIQQVGVKLHMENI